MAFELPKLPYAYDALEPYIDAQTMEIHYTKHHQTYVNNLNKAISGTSMEGHALEELLTRHDDQIAVRNNGGGHWNHSFFWASLCTGGSAPPSGGLGQAIDEAFGSFSGFKEAFTKAALGRFGSGWIWLCLCGGLDICSTANQDNPLIPSSGAPCAEVGCTPLLGLDVWEHAYYLRYQNRRPEYVEAFFHVVDWRKVAERFQSAV